MMTSLKEELEIETNIGRMRICLEKEAGVYTDDDGLMWLVIMDGNFAYRINRVQDEYCLVVEDSFKKPEIKEVVKSASSPATPKDDGYFIRSKRYRNKITGEIKTVIPILEMGDYEEVLE